MPRPDCPITSRLLHGIECAEVHANSHHILMATSFVVGFWYMEICHVWMWDLFSVFLEATRPHSYNSMRAMMFFFYLSLLPPSLLSSAPASPAITPVPRVGRHEKNCRNYFLKWHEWQTNERMNDQMNGCESL